MSKEFVSGGKVRFTNPAYSWYGKVFTLKRPKPGFPNGYVWEVEEGSLSFQASNLELLSYPETAHHVGPLPNRPALPTDSDKRKEYPLYSGLLAYFPAALAQVSNHSYVGNQKHNPGKPLQHARGVSGDHADCILRHLVDSAEHPKGSPARIDELRALAWRSLALLQEELEMTGVVPAPAATFDRAS